MKACLNQATLLTADLETFVRAASAAEFDAVELRTEKVRESLKRREKAEVSELIRSLGLEVASLNALESFTLDERQFAKAMDEAKEMMRICDVVGSKRIVAISAPMLSGLREQDAIQRTKVGLEKLARLGSEYGVNVCFEFLGFKSRSVRTLEESWSVLKELPSNQVNLVIDTFHFYVGGSSLDSLEDVPVERLSVVHINDVERKARDELRDGNRVLPGEGVMNPKTLIDRLRAKGYAGPLSVELFREDYWKQDPMSVARKARQSLDKFLSPHAH